MSRFQHSRDNVLDDCERATSARKCISLIRGAGVVGDLTAKSSEFFLKHEGLSKNIRYAPSEPELQYLRDLVERFVTS